MILHGIVNVVIVNYISLFVYNIKNTYLSSGISMSSRPGVSMVTRSVW